MSHFCIPVLAGVLHCSLVQGHSNSTPHGKQTLLLSRLKDLFSWAQFRSPSPWQPVFRGFTSHPSQQGNIHSASWGENPTTQYQYAPSLKSTATKQNRINNKNFPQAHLALSGNQPNRNSNLIKLSCLPCKAQEISNWFYN